MTRSANSPRHGTDPTTPRRASGLVDVGRAVLARVADFPDVHAVWSIRLAGIARWFIEWEATRDADIAKRHPEIKGDMELVFAGAAFHLRGRADRIDLRRDGMVDILDFKTGTPPSANQVIVGFSPQLGLEAAMAKAGAFGPDFAGRAVANLAWIGLSQVDRGKPLKTAVAKDYTADGVGERTIAQFEALLRLFENPDHPYISRARPDVRDALRGRLRPSRPRARMGAALLRG